MKRTTLAVFTGLVLSASGAAAVAGQQHQHRADSTATTSSGMMHGMQQTQGMTQCPMMTAGMEMGMGMGMPGSAMVSPEMLLRMAEPLGLAQEQISRLEAVRDSRGAPQQMHEAMDAHQKAMTSLQGSAPSVEAYEQALRQVVDRMVAMHTAMAQAAIDARAVLTPDQLARLDTGMQMMKQMMGSGMMGGMGSGMMDGMGSGMMGAMGSGMMRGMGSDTMGMTRTHSMRRGGPDGAGGR